MAKRIIAIDIDDVLSDTNEAVRLWANAAAGANLQPEHYLIEAEYWSYYDRVWAQHNIGHLQFVDFEQALINDEIQMPVLADAAFAIKELKKDFKVVLVTSRHPKLLEGTRRWVNEHLGDDVNVHLAINGHTKVGLPKGELCVQLGAFLLIDDNSSHIQSAIDNGIEGILFGHSGWQTHLPDGAKQFDSWSEILDYVRR